MCQPVAAPGGRQGAGAVVNMNGLVGLAENDRKMFDLVMHLAKYLHNSPRPVEEVLAELHYHYRKNYICVHGVVRLLTILSTNEEDQDQGQDIHAE